jgi:hypothetical protein
VILEVLLLSFAYGANDVDVLGTPVNDKTAVRFFFQPGNYFHAPLILRVVAASDPRLNTAPMLVEGRTAYITVPEMRHFLDGLENAELSWHESKQKMVFGDATKIFGPDALVIVVVTPKGTADAQVDPSKICKELAPLDKAFSTPRALWEFQIFRAEYNCKVPGLNGQAYPDHWPWNTDRGNGTRPQPQE